MNDADLTTIQAASLSDVGRKRKTNQDHCGEFEGAAGERILVLCDGMGGHQGGEVASQLAVATIGEVVAGGGAPPEELLRKSFAHAHERLRTRAAEDPSLRGMGTTAVALLAPDDESVWVAHTGDSRAYRVRAGHVEQLTADHSVVAEQLRRGLITPAEAEQLPHNELLHALGASSQLRIDVGRHDLRSGDRFLLCSDGLWSLVGEREMATLSLQLEPAAAVRSLVELANERGANDNVTVQVLAFGPPGEAAVAPGEDETERDLEALHAARAERGAEGRVAANPDVTVVADAATLEEIWERARGVARARRRRRLRLATVAAAFVAILLLGALVWLRYAMESGSAGESRAAAEAGANEPTPPDVAAPSASGDVAP
jgi:protein phosphatase